MDDLIEQLAEKEHESWAHWMLYLFAVCPANDDGTVNIPAELVARWNRQAHTGYAALSEAEKESDRAEVRHILPIIEAHRREG